MNPLRAILAIFWACSSYAKELWREHILDHDYNIWPHLYQKERDD